MKIFFCGFVIDFVFTGISENLAVPRRWLRGFIRKDKKKPADFCVFVFGKPKNAVSGDDSKKTAADSGLVVSSEADFSFIFSPKNGVAVSFLKPEKTAFIGLLRKLLPEFLLRKGGFILHSAGVKCHSGGYLLSGRSGSGKTTLAKKFDRVYSDDLTPVIKKKGKYFIYPSFFWGELRRGKKFFPFPSPLTAVCFLKKDRRNLAVPLRPKKAFMKLVRNVLYFGSEPDRVLSLCDEFVRENRFYMLKFRKDCDISSMLV